MHHLRPEYFTARVGMDFAVVGTDPVIALTLVAVEPISNSTREGGGFSLLLRGPVAPAIAQGTLELAGDEESFALFVVAIGRTDAGVDYQAVFC